MRPTSPRLTAVVVSVAVLTACAAAPAVTPAAAVDVDDWAAVVAAARGQTLDWYMDDGDEVVRTVVEEYVAPRLRPEPDGQLSTGAARHPQPGAQAATRAAPGPG